MSKTCKTIYLLSFVLLMHFFNVSFATVAEKEKKLSVFSGETLYYKLSYQGLLTSMIWADIADAKMTVVANQKTPEQKNGYQLVLNLSTENYAKAEIIHPVRYTYTATVDEALQRTLLVEKKDNGSSNSHEFIWLDWLNKQTQLYKKREKKPLTSSLLWEEEKLAWENDGAVKVPPFLSHFPQLDENHSYLIHKKSGNKINSAQILEPLSMIYYVRTHDFDTIAETTLIIKENIRLYRIRRVGLEDIEVNRIKYQAIKYKIEKEGETNEQYYMWLSNNKKKVPLQFTADAPLGQVEIKLVKISSTDKLEENKLRNLNS